MTPKQRKAKIAKCWRELNAIHKHARSKRGEIQQLIDECKHEDQSSTCDPSGGSDRAYHCNICGKDW